jgi:peptidoglycan hydrolase-like protein with peptidoglycan-binding domain
MIAAMTASEDQQLEAVVKFVQAKKLVSALQAKNWPAYAAGYNGSDYARNNYDTNLAQAYALYQNPSALPDITVRAAQLMLLMLGFNPNGVDGSLGPGTIAALHSFQSKQQMALTTAIDEGVLAMLSAALPAAGNLALS